MDSWPKSIQKICFPPQELSNSAFDTSIEIEQCFSKFLTQFLSYDISNSELPTVMLIYRLHNLKYIASSPIRRHFLWNKCIFKMLILVPWSPHKLFRFVHCRFKDKSPKMCDFWLCKEWKNGCGDFISGQNLIQLT